MIELAKMRQTHISWAEYFEEHPDVAAEYTATGEWDSAVEHRRLATIYDHAIAMCRMTAQLDLLRPPPDSAASA